MKKIIPNLFTLSNLASGNLAIIAIFSHLYSVALGLIIAALVFDFLDGFAARQLGVHSEMGKQLDSLADIVSFGVAPGVFLFMLMRTAMDQGSEPIPAFLPYITVLIPIFTALRLARFNVDTEQEDFFIGLPSPAGALFLTTYSYWALTTDDVFARDLLMHPFLITLCVIGTSLFLVARIPMLSLKFKNSSWRENRGRILLILLSVVLIVLFRFRAVAFIFPLYLLLSFIINAQKRK